MSYGMRKMRHHGGYGVVICDTQTEDSLYMRERTNRNVILSIVLNCRNSEFAMFHMPTT
jgi:hypothetical protein